MVERYCCLESCDRAVPTASRHGLCVVHERDRGFGALSAEDALRVYERSAYRAELRVHDGATLAAEGFYSGWIDRRLGTTTDADAFDVDYARGYWRGWRGEPSG